MSIRHIAQALTIAAGANDSGLSPNLGSSVTAGARR